MLVLWKATKAFKLEFGGGQVWCGVVVEVCVERPWLRSRVVKLLL